VTPKGWVRGEKNLKTAAAAFCNRCYVAPALGQLDQAFQFIKNIPALLAQEYLRPSSCGLLEKNHFRMQR